MEPSENIVIRPLKFTDLEAVCRIDYSLLGKKRDVYWENRLEKAEVSGLPSLAAEVDGTVIGFIIGSSSGWEYGVPENVGWIDSMGVAGEWQDKGVSQLLFQKIYEIFKTVGVDKIYVFVDWKKWDILKFFDNMGFRRGDMVNFRLSL
ncbi:MAG TPA: GNAT family N-acetyltransferase [Syntrophorhabdaceae bacterium]|jgi:GNAT superfamily N-acetyltransferase